MSAGNDAPVAEDASACPVTSARWEETGVEAALGGETGGQAADLPGPAAVLPAARYLVRAHLEASVMIRSNGPSGVIRCHR